MELVLVVGAVELTGLYKQLNGLGHSCKGVRDPAHFDLLSSAVLACPDPCSKCACDDDALKGRDRWGVEEGVDAGGGCIRTPVAPILCVFYGRLRSLFDTRRCQLRAGLPGHQETEDGQQYIKHSPSPNLPVSQRVLQRGRLLHTMYVQYVSSYIKVQKE